MEKRIGRLFSIVAAICIFCTLFPVKVLATEPFTVNWLSQKYDEVFPFKDGMGAGHKNNTIIFFDKTGKEIAQPFRGVVFNKYGLTQVSLDHTKYGLMDNKGKMIAPIMYDVIGDLSEGLMSLTKDGKTGYMDETGKLVIPLKYDAAMEFREGLAPVGTRVKGGFAGDKWGFIDKTGKVIIPLKYTFARNFSEGLAWVAEGDGYNYRYGAIDKTGKVIIPFQYLEPNDFKNGVAKVLLYGDRFYIDKTGRRLSWEEQYKASLDFTDGLTKVLQFGGNYVYLDETLKEIYPPTSDIGNFSEGMASVRQGMKYGFIDKTGKVVVPCIYDYVSDFTEGLALTRTGENRSFIDKTGNTVIALPYARAELFNEGLARVRTGMHYGLIDKRGKEIVPLIYQNIEPFKDGYAVVTNDDFRKGVINRKGEVVVPLIYNKITAFSEGAAYATLGDKVGILLAPGNYIYDLPKAAQAVPAASKVMVNGKETVFEAYTINGRDYFKLRDLAYVLNGTEKQFGIVWDNNKKAINISTNNRYIATGVEMAPGDGKSKSAVISTSDIYSDDSKVLVAAYTINGNNYFELGRIGEILDFAVIRDEKTQTVNIDTAR